MVVLEPGLRGIVTSKGFSLYNTYVVFADGHEGSIPTHKLKEVE